MLTSALLLLLCTFNPGAKAQSVTGALTVPLQTPAGLAFDAAGNLYIAEPSSHTVIRVTPAGVLSNYAGTGTQGFAGDGGPAANALLDAPTGLAITPAGDLYVSDPHVNRIRRIEAASGVISTVAGTGEPGSSPDGTLATAARLDGPTALALDPAGDLLFAESRNHRIRRIDFQSGVLSSTAGNGLQGYSGDGGPALAAALDSPTGLATDAVGNLYIADSHNQRIRRVDALTYIITTVAGTGAPAFSGDAAPATAAALHLPRGVTVDASGNLYLADMANQRIRRVDAVTGQITTIVGAGTEAFAGDGGPAQDALLDHPTAVAITSAGLPTLSDAGNLRVRQVDANGVIRTIAGLGSTTGSSLTLALPSAVAYGSGSVIATLAASAATGAVIFFDQAAATPVTLGSVGLTSNAATLSLDQLAAGPHLLFATYAGDPSHGAAKSNLASLTVKPLPVSVTPAPVSLLYGQPVPALTASLTGILPRDAARVALLLSSAAIAASPPGSYPIQANLTGAAAANYAVSVDSAAVTITPAPTHAALTQSASGTSFIAHVTSATSGTPTGTVRLLDGTALLGAGTLAATGDVSFTAATLSAGTHTLTAVYTGDNDFLAATSAPDLVSIAPAGGGATPDFTLAATGQTSVTVPSGSAAAFSFAVAPVNGGLSSPIQLAASGLPAGGSASFNPAYLPSGGTVSAFVLTISTPKASLEWPRMDSGRTWAWALLFPFLLATARRKARRPLLLAAVMGALLSLGGCGDRTNLAQSGSATASKTYSITVTATATATSGTVLTHTAGVTLVVQ